MGYDAQPYKLRPCRYRWEQCKEVAPSVRSALLPDPGVALDPGVDHWHILPRGGGDNRGARDLQRWKTLMLTLTRCEHGRVQKDVCYACPDGYAPDRSGTEVGWTYDRERVVIPPREEHNEPDAWVQKLP